MAIDAAPGKGSNIASVFRRFQIKENSMRTLRTALAATAVLLASAIAAQAQTKVAIGKVLSGNGFHIPTYVAMDKGFYKEEGLDARFVQLSGSALVKAALTGAVDFIPIPSGGSQAALSGAEIRYVVGQSLKSQWLIAVRPEIKKPEDLKGKIIGYGRAGAADYDEGAAVLSRFFKMDVAKDYKVISFQGETERIAALVNGDIQAALISVPHAPKALNAGMKILVRTGDYIPRLGGTFLTHKDFIKEKRDVVKRFTRGMIKATDYIKANKKGTMDVVQKYFEIQDAKIVEGIYNLVFDKYSPEMPPDLIKILFESRTTPELGWPQGKPLPELNQFVARSIVNEVLKEMGRKPGGK
ncbi:MAG: ABC transporter substrate-binding protein [Alphaproteobacteria bacterium]